MSIKRIAAIEDICGIGRCALAVALPIISAYGYQACPVPTAVLSAHTAFEEPIKADMSAYLEKALCWYDDYAFDAVMTGYLLSPAQALAVAEYLARNRERAGLVLVDPAMADDGRLYRSLPEDMPGAYRALAKHADILMPNATEAALLTGLPFDAPAEALAQGLLALGPKRVIIKGLQKDGKNVNACAEAGKIEFVEYEKRPGSYPGAGDMFKSVFLCEVMLGADMRRAIAQAAGMVAAAIDEAIAEASPPREGLPFERLLYKTLLPHENTRR